MRVIVEDPPADRVITAPAEPPHLIVTEDEDLGEGAGVIVVQDQPTTVVTALEVSSRVITTTPDPTQVVISSEPPGVQVVYADPNLDHVIQPITLQHVTISSPDETGQMLVAVSNRGPKGDPGDVTVAEQGWMWIQEMPQAVWDIEHTLAFTPAGIIVFGDDGYQYDGFLVQYGGYINDDDEFVSVVRLTFDIPLAGTAWLS